jgi:hypothetical protein
MNGQWLGIYSGTNTGNITVNIDERSHYYEGAAYAIDKDAKLPSSVVFFRTENKDANFKFRTALIQAVDPATGNTVPWESLKNRFAQDTMFPTYADVTGTFEKDSLTLKWVTDIGSNGACVLPRSKSGEPSDLAPWRRTGPSFGSTFLD